MEKNHLCEKEVGPLRRRIKRANSLDLLTEPGIVSMAEPDTTVRTKLCQDDSCVKQVNSYTKGRLVQGHRVY